MSDLILGVGDFAATRTAGIQVKTFALGSCVAVMLLDPATRTVGMVHVALPDSAINAQKSREKPGYFADTGIPALLNIMAGYGCTGNGRGMIVKLAGGASIMDDNETFNIGKRNQAAIKNILRAQGLEVVAEDLGENYSRTVSISVDTGQVTIFCPGRGQWHI
ncbi:MAG: chemotaxis protein CheD [Deltaproteobacteria bacterium RIFOXYD12_FULL_57_12]|nr:MAG: chemotaxis protein CheD [Deltaproteobacteria bacterium RIFOXYD12_FULL_57_12]